MIIRDAKGITAEVHLYDNNTGIDLSRNISTQALLPAMQTGFTRSMMYITSTTMQPMRATVAILILKTVLTQNGLLRMSEQCSICFGF